MYCGQVRNKTSTEEYNRGGEHKTKWEGMKVWHDPDAWMPGNATREDCPSGAWTDAQMLDLQSEDSC